MIFVGNGIINGSGHTLMTTLISLIALWIVRVPTAIFLSRHLNSVTGVWWAISISFFTAMTISVSYFLSGRWKRPIIRKTFATNDPELAS
jgi:Na+-driven multidrug efflux pump